MIFLLHPDQCQWPQWHLLRHVNEIPEILLACGGGGGGGMANSHCTHRAGVPKIVKFLALVWVHVTAA